MTGNMGRLMSGLPGNGDIKDIDRCISLYKAQLEQGDIRKAYNYLMHYVMHLKVQLSSNFPDRFSFGNISPGYMDFTYFPFFDAFLRERKLRLGLVLNHRYVRFELWLMGQNAAIQKYYWNLLKSSPWNTGRSKMPRYSVLEAVLVEFPDFREAAELTQKINREASRVSEEVIGSIRASEAR